MLHRYGRCRTFRLCMSCGKLVWPGQRALFTECGPSTENAYHRGRGCAVSGRPVDIMKQERTWHEEVKRRAREGEGNG